MSERLKFLVIYDPSSDISEAIKIDKKYLADYCERLIVEGYDIDYEEVSSQTITSYNDITKKCQHKTRVIIWYIGHGKNKSNQERTKNQFPGFLGNKIFIQQHKILKLLPRNILNVIIFDCCSNSPSYRESPAITITVKNNFTTLFDFKGKMLINSSKRNQSSFCRSSEQGSEFITSFISKFNDTYDNTLNILSYLSPDIITYGSLQYEKYIKEDELISKSDF